MHEPLHTYVNAMANIFHLSSTQDDEYSYISASRGLCGLEVRVLGYRSRGSGSIPDTTRFAAM
jgi:hypothetical protein